MNNSFFQSSTFLNIFSTWFINKNENSTRYNLFDTIYYLLSRPLKMSKTLHTHKVFFHKNVSQRPSQRYDFENNNRRNPGNEVAQIDL